MEARSFVISGTKMRSQKRKLNKVGSWLLKFLTFEDFFFVSFAFVEKLEVLSFLNKMGSESSKGSWLGTGS